MPDWTDRRSNSGGANPANGNRAQGGAHGYSNAAPQRPVLPLSKDYLDALKEGYFTATTQGIGGVIRKEFLVTFPDQVAASFGGMTYTQIRSFFETVRSAEAAFHYAWDSEKKQDAQDRLLVKIQRLAGIASYAYARGGVPENFRVFILANIEACQNSKDVLEGFIPHFEAVVGFFRYLFPNQK